MGETTKNLAAGALTFSILSFLLLIPTLLLFVFPDFAATVRAAFSGGPATGGVLNSLKTVGALLGAFSPDITLLSGFVSDIMNGSFRYSVTSLIGIGAIILHWIVAGFYYRLLGAPVAASASSSAASVAAAASTASASVASAVSSVLGTGSEPGGGGVAASGGGGAGLLGALGLGETGLSKAIAASGSDPGRGRSRSISSISTAPLGTPALGSRPTRAAAAASAAATSRLAATGALGGRGVSSVTGGQRGGARGDFPDYIKAKFNPCSVRGLGMFDISQSPMGMAALSSIFTVYLLDMTVGQKRQGTEVGVYLLFSTVVYGLNIFAYKEFSCYGDTYGQNVAKTFLPIVIGTVSGISGWAVLSSTFPQYLPLDNQSVGNTVGGARCNAPNDKDQFVCETYKDGKRV
jgi:hypothetical protein